MTCSGLDKSAAVITGCTPETTRSLRTVLELEALCGFVRIGSLCLGAAFPLSEHVSFLCVQRGREKQQEE